MSTAQAHPTMDEESAAFATIEEAVDYVKLLKGAAEQSQIEIQADLAVIAATRSRARREALLLIDYKLRQLNQQLATTGRLLADLRALRDLYEASESEQRDTPCPVPFRRLGLAAAPGGPKPVTARSLRPQSAIALGRS